MLIKISIREPGAMLKPTVHDWHVSGIGIRHRSRDHYGPQHVLPCNYMAIRYLD